MHVHKYTYICMRIHGGDDDDDGDDDGAGDGAGDGDDGDHADGNADCGHGAVADDDAGSVLWHCDA